MRRRTLLASLSALGATPFAGCLGDRSDPSEEENGNNDEDENNDEEPVDENEIEWIDSVPLGTELDDLETPWWHEYDADAPGAVYFFDEPRVQDRLPWVVEDPEDKRSELWDEINFHTGVAILIGSAGPNACYDRIDVGDFDIEDGTVVGSATAVESNGDGCSDETTFPWVLVGLEATKSRPEGVRISITDGWGNEDEVVPKLHHLDPDTLDGYVHPEGDPPQIPPTLECPDDGFVRHYPGAEDVPLGETEDYQGVPGTLRVAQRTYEYGETLTVKLRNLTDRYLHTGDHSKFNLQVKTEAEWEDVRGHDEADALGYPGLEVSHAPGEGFDWEIELTEEGIADAVDRMSDILHVCPELQEGRYRFVYFGLDVAVEFDLLFPD